MQSWDAPACGSGGARTPAHADACALSAVDRSGGAVPPVRRGSHVVLTGGPPRLAVQACSPPRNPPRERWVPTRRSPAPVLTWMAGREDFRSVLQLRRTCSHLFSAASFAPISFAIKAKENDLLPLEKNRVKLDDDSDDDEESKEGQESSSSAPSTAPAAAPPCVIVEEKRPQLTQEELEAKQGL